RRRPRARRDRPGDESDVHDRAGLRGWGARGGAHRSLPAALACRRGPRAARRLPHARADRLRRVAGDRGARAPAAGRAREDRAPRRRPPRDRGRMNILGFDTSTAATSACLLRDDGQAFEVIPDEIALLGPPGHARELMPAVARVLADAGLGYDDVD